MSFGQQRRDVQGDIWSKSSKEMAVCRRETGTNSTSHPLVHREDQWRIPLLNEALTTGEGGRKRTDGEDRTAGQPLIS